MTKKFFNKSTEKSRKQIEPSKTKTKSTSQSTLARLAIDSRARRRYDKALQILKEHSIVNKSIIYTQKLFSKDYQLQSWFWDIGLSEFFEAMADKDPEDPADEPGDETGLTICRHHEATEVFLAVSDRYPELRKKLPRALRVLTAWGRQLSVVRAPPMGVLLLSAVVALARLQKCDSFACGCLLMFGCLLRPAEYFKLRVRDLNLKVHGFNLKLRDAQRLIIKLGFQTKSSVMQEHVTLESENAIRCLKETYENSPDDAKLWTLSEKCFREKFSELCAKFPEFDEISFRLYSLRRGGASYFFAKDQNLPHLCQRGRWKSERSARVYIRSGAAEQLDGQISQKSLVFLNYLFSRFGKF
jgi:hypothetical protein